MPRRIIDGVDETLLRRGAWALATPILVAATLLSGCGRAVATDSPAWSPVPSRVLAPAPGSVPLAESVSAGAGKAPWLIGGVVVGPAGAPSVVTGPGGLRATGSRSVAIWSAASRTGPWSLDAMQPDPERDGPNETIQYMAAGQQPAMAFGWRDSPIEGYPRPSVWLSSSPRYAPWNEVIEPREFFGGPDIIGFGGVSAGPHGYFIAGTWTDPSGRPVVSVWHSGDGATWARQADLASFQIEPGELPFGRGIADAAAGVLLVATVEVPSPSDPGRELGALWYSKDGRRWQRLSTGPLTARSERATLDAVTGLPGGWLIAGTEGAAGSLRPIAWFVPDDLRPGPPVLLPEPQGEPRAAAADPEVTGLSASATRIVVAGAAGGRPLLWAAPLHAGRPGSWTVVAPPGAAGDVSSVGVSTAGSGTIITLIGKSSTSVWVTGWH